MDDKCGENMKEELLSGFCIGNKFVSFKKRSMHANGRGNRSVRPLSRLKCPFFNLHIALTHTHKHTYSVLNARNGHWVQFSKESNHFSFLLGQMSFKCWLTRFNGNYKKHWEHQKQHFTKRWIEDNDEEKVKKKWSQREKHVNSLFYYCELAFKSIKFDSLGSGNWCSLSDNLRSFSAFFVNKNAPLNCKFTVFCFCFSFVAAIKMENSSWHNT